MRRVQSTDSIIGETMPKVKQELLLQNLPSVSRKLFEEAHSLRFGSNRDKLFELIVSAMAWLPDLDIVPTGALAEYCDCSPAYISRCKGALTNRQGKGLWDQLPESKGKGDEYIKREIAKQGGIAGFIKAYNPPARRASKAGNVGQVVGATVDTVVKASKDKAKTLLDMLALIKATIVSENVAFDNGQADALFSLSSDILELASEMEANQQLKEQAAHDVGAASSAA